MFGKVSYQLLYGGLLLLALVGCSSSERVEGILEQLRPLPTGAVPASPPGSVSAVYALGAGVQLSFGTDLARSDLVFPVDTVLFFNSMDEFVNAFKGGTHGIVFALFPQAIPVEGAETAVTLYTEVTGAVDRESVQPQQLREFFITTEAQISPIAGGEASSVGDPQIEIGPAQIIGEMITYRSDTNFNASLRGLERELCPGQAPGALGSCVGGSGFGQFLLVDKSAPTSDYRLVLVANTGSGPDSWRACQQNVNYWYRLRYCLRWW